MTPALAAGVLFFYSAAMNYTTLISADELAQCINNADVRIIDCRFNLANTEAGQQAWAEAHIAGALYAHLDNDLSADKTQLTGRHPIPERSTLAARFRQWGINNDTQIVAYDAMGGAMASRLWWLARWLGHEKVAVLDGGLAAWQAINGEMNADIPDYQEGDFVEQSPLSENLDVAQLSKLLEQQSITLIDARDAARFRGEQDNIDPVAGHVPGALNYFFMQNLDENGRFKSAEELKASFSSFLADKEASDIVHMCGSGVTACHNLLAMQHAGIKDGRIYIGSWSEWIRDSDRPVATGDA